MKLLRTRGRIVLLVILAGLPALALTIYSTWDERARAQVQARDNMQRLALQAAQRQQQIVESAKQTLAAISLNPASVQADQKSCNAFLAELLARSSGLYHTMGIYRDDALLICNAVPWQGNVYSPDRLYFHMALATGKFAIGDYQIGRVTQQQGINFGYPVTDETGVVSAVAFVAVDLDKLNQMAADNHFPDQAIVTVVDRDGTVLARHPLKAGTVGEKLQNPQVLDMVRSGRSGVFQLHASDGIERLWAYETVADNPDGVIPMKVLVSIPMDVVFAEANRALVRNLIGIALATTLLLIGAWYGTGIYVLRKVELLLKAARRVHSGDLDARTGMSDDGGELSLIGASFDEMTQALQDRDNDLQLVLKQLNEQVITDPLTGLNNRRYLMGFLHREFERARRSASTVAAIMLDIDHFKRINDEFGHAAGDLVLTELARLLNQSIRGSDMVCRYGGEEFLLILPGATLDGARLRAEQIRRLINNQNMKFNGQPLGLITVSLGVALFPDHAADTESLIRAADEALYESKNAGRNRVSVRVTSCNALAAAAETATL